MFKITPIPILSDNYVWLIHNQSDAIVVDPGDAAPVANAIEEKQLTLQGILVTHSHYDHVDGIEALRAINPCPVWGECSIPHVTNAVADGDSLAIAQAHFDVISVPGHMPEHLAYTFRNGNEHHVFSGDVLFSSGCGRIFNGTHQELKSSIDRLSALGDDTIVHCTHEYTLSNLTFAKAVEPENQDIAARETEAKSLREQGLPTLPFTISDEKKVNPFLRCNVPNVIKRAAEQLKREPIDELEVFTSLRKWKDTF